MLSEFRASAVDALEKAKTVISNRQLGGFDGVGTGTGTGTSQQQQQNDIDDDDYIKNLENDDNNNSSAIVNNSILNSPNNTNNRSSIVLNELRTSSTRALEKAKLMFVSSSSILIRSNSNNNDTMDDPESSPTKNLTSTIDSNSNNNTNNNNVQTASSTSSTTSNIDRLEELSHYCPKLTYKQRIIGFFTSFGIGYLIAFFSFRFFIDLIEGHPLPFALNYTFGHVLQLLASTFLCGPKRQFKNMFDEKRRQTSIVYLSCLVITLTIVFIPMPKQIKLILLLSVMMVQFCASCWYSLSYIPYGRTTVKRLVKTYLGIEQQSSSTTTTTTSENSFISMIPFPGRSGVLT